MKKTFLWLTMVFSMLAITSCTYALGASDRPAGDSNPAATPAPIEKVLSTFRPIEGTNYLIAQISADPTAREVSSDPLSWIRSGYSAYGYQTYNYVFFNLDTETYHRLLPDNNSVILQIIGFPTPTYDSSGTLQTQPIEWWLYTVVTADTDQNGHRDYDDKLTLGVSDVGGNGYKELVTGVDNMLGQIYKDSSTLFIIYNSDSKNYLAKVNLPAREVVSTTEMDLGGDVK